MFEGLYNAASGVVAQARVQEVIADNIAKAVVTGHKRTGIVTRPFTSELNSAITELKTIGSQVGGVQVDRTYTVFDQGTIKNTGNPLDLAIEGDGFFVVQMNDKEFYTRNGNFSVNNEGTLVTPDGNSVLGESGNSINLYPNKGTDEGKISKISIDQDGTIFMRKEGAGQDTKIGKLKIVAFEDVSKLTPVGESLFTTNGQGPKQSENYHVNQGYLEESNVSIIDEMVSMITNMRIYETNQKMLKNMSDIYSRSINEVGRA